MDTKALHTLSPGVYLVTSKIGEKVNGQIASTVFQVTSEPRTIAVSINKENLTNGYIRCGQAFAVSVLSEDAPMSLIKQFGFRSGRDGDKFLGVNYRLTGRGLPYVTEGSLGFIEAEVIQSLNVGTHTIFIGEVTDAKVLKEGSPMTYSYYHKVKKGTTPPSAPTYVKAAASQKGGDKYECTVCGYVYDPSIGDTENGVAPGTAFEDLPDAWVCPICGAGKDVFDKID